MSKNYNVSESLEGPAGVATWMEEAHSPRKEGAGVCEWKKRKRH